MADYRRIYEKAHGPIPPGLLIHHIDGDETNNAIENLQAMTPSDHRKLHAKWILDREAEEGGRYRRIPVFRPRRAAPGGGRP